MEPDGRSLSEAETLLLLAIRLTYVKRPDAEIAFGLADEIGRMLTAMRAKLR